jgi:hypothetical protein
MDFNGLKKAPAMMAGAKIFTSRIGYLLSLLQNRQAILTFTNDVTCGYLIQCPILYLFREEVKCPCRTVLQRRLTAVKIIGISL